MDWQKILEDLIRIDTSNPPGRNYQRLIDYLEPLFQNEGGLAIQKRFIPRVYANELPDRVALLARRLNPGKPRLIVYAHVDTVPAEGWDAFHPRLEDGKLFGRGAADDKGAIPALLIALERTKQKPINWDLSVMITTDEETSQAGQIRYLGQFLQLYGRKDTYFLELDSEAGYVTIAGLAALQIEIKVKGKSVHSGESHLGINAIETSIPLLSALAELKKAVEKRRSKIEANPETGLTYLTSKLNINMIRGGIKENIVPDQCFITIDRRLIPEESLDEAETEILAAMGGLADWEITKKLKLPTVVTDANDPAVERLADIIRDVTGKTGKYGVMGSGDYAEIVSSWGAKILGIGVIRPECNIHAKNEFVYLKDVENLAKIIEKFLTF